LKRSRRLGPDLPCLAEAAAGAVGAGVGSAMPALCRAGWHMRNRGRLRPLCRVRWTQRLHARPCA
jgi:hypothetical protein